MPLPVINAIWIGPKLGPVHAACLRSFVRHGHRVVLHVYETPSDVPEGIALSDANALLPKERIVRYRRGGGLSLFSNLLRYEIMRQGLGLYVDCDIYCLEPLEDQDYIFGWESIHTINNAVLKLPAESPVVDHLCRIKDGAFIPLFAGPRRVAYCKARAALGIPVKIEDLPWGFTGPQALTWYLRQNNLTQEALPIDYFYPVHFEQVSLLLDPDLKIADVVTSRTKYLHVSNEVLKRMKVSDIPETSVFGQIITS